MKKIFSYLLIISFIACQPKDDLTQMKSDLASKKAELLTLQGDIKTLNEAIEKLEPTKKVDSILVKTIQLKPTDFTKYANLQASVVSDDLTYASSEVGGRIINLFVKEGDQIKKGQLIASIDLDAIQKQKEEIETSLSLAKTVFERQKNLWDQEIGSEIQFLQAKNNMERLEKSISTINTQLSKKNVYAPISGYVEKEFSKAGEICAPGSPIIEILNNYSLKIKADVPENYLTKVKSGDIVDISLPALNETMKSKITQLGRTIDPANRTFKIEVALKNDKNIYKPNLLAEVKIKEFEQKNAIVIPIDYVLEEVSGQKFVYKVNQTKDGAKAEKVDVTLGESFDGQVIVLEGLKEDDQLITEGSHLIIDGSLLDIFNNQK
jgi:RND family efflux transporter MFP subunit